MDWENYGGDTGGGGDDDVDTHEHDVSRMQNESVVLRKGGQRRSNTRRVFV